MIISPLPDGAGETGRFLALSRDITERVLSAKALADANSGLAKDARQLEQRVRERTGELEQAHRRVVTLAGKLVRSQEDERRTTAHELHDEGGQKLTAFRLLLERARRPSRLSGGTASEQSAQPFAHDLMIFGDENVDHG